MYWCNSGINISFYSLTFLHTEVDVLSTFGIQFLWICPRLWIADYLFRGYLFQNTNKEILTVWVFLRIDKTFAGFGITMINLHVYTWWYHTTDKREQDLINQYFFQLIHSFFTRVWISSKLIFAYIPATQLDKFIVNRQKQRNNEDESVFACLA